MSIYTFKDFILEKYSFNKTIIDETDLKKIIGNLNLVTIPYFDTEDSLLEHIQNNFDKSDAVILFNPPESFNNVSMDENHTILYTYKKAYILKDFTEGDFDRVCSELNINI